MKSSEVFRKAAELMHATPTKHFGSVVEDAGGGSLEGEFLTAMLDLECGDSFVTLTGTERVMLLLLAAELAKDAERRQRKAQVFTKAAELMVKLPALPFFNAVLKAGGQFDDFHWFIREVAGPVVERGTPVGAERGMLLLLAAEVARDQA